MSTAHTAPIRLTGGKNSVAGRQRRFDMFEGGRLDGPDPARRNSTAGTANQRARKWVAGNQPLLKMLEAIKDLTKI